MTFEKEKIFNNLVSIFQAITSDKVNDLKKALELIESFFRNHKEFNILGEELSKKLKNLYENLKQGIFTLETLKEHISKQLLPETLNVYINY